MKKLYYEEDESEFYFVKQTPKTIKIDWVVNLNCDGSELDQNVRWKNLIVKKDNSGKHCLKENDEERTLIYPFRGGNPFYLKLATMSHITSEIVECENWGVSSNYYENLKKLVEGAN